MCEDVITKNTYTLIDFSYLGCAVADHIIVIAIISGTQDKPAVIRQGMYNEVINANALDLFRTQFAGHVQINSQCCRNPRTELDPKAWCLGSMLALAQAPVLVNNQTTTGYR